MVAVYSSDETIQLTTQVYINTINESFMSNATIKSFDVLGENVRGKKCQNIW